MARVVIALQRPTWQLLWPGPLGNGGVFGSDARNRGGADAEEVAKRGLYHVAMCHDHNGFAVVLLFDPMQRNMYSRRELQLAFTAWRPAVVRLLRLGQPSPAHVEFFLAQMAIVAAALL